MAFQRKRVTKEEFFEQNSLNCTNEFLAENAYILIHTMYLKDGIKIKPEMGKYWDRLFKVYMEDDTFEYMIANEPVFLRYNIVEEVFQNKEIASMKFLVKTVVALEFDLWLVERSEQRMPLHLPEFEAYIHEKYGHFLDNQYKNFRRFDLAHIREYSGIAKELEPYYSKILDFYQRIINCNKMRIEMDAPDTERTKEYSRRVTGQPAKEARTLPDVQEEQFQKQQSTDREYQIILKEKEERIEKLEQDIREFKRQRDEAREYSVNQYDKGIKDLFGAMNDVRYGKVMDYLYKLLGADDTNEQLASYLDNLFMALEDMELEPIVADGQPVVNRENLIREYNLDFDKSAYEEGKTALKYAGWKYKDIPIEKPTLMLKEEQ